MSSDAITQEDTRVALGRFRIAWIQERAMALPPGYTVFDHGKRITITWPTLEEAQQHLDAIARLYQRYGW